VPNTARNSKAHHNPPARSRAAAKESSHGRKPVVCVRSRRAAPIGAKENSRAQNERAAFSVSLFDYFLGESLLESSRGGRLSFRLPSRGRRRLSCVQRVGVYYFFFAAFFFAAGFFAFVAVFFFLAAAIFVLSLLSARHRRAA